MESFFNSFYSVYMIRISFCYRLLLFFTQIIPTMMEISLPRRGYVSGRTPTHIYNSGLTNERTDGRTNGPTEGRKELGCHGWKQPRTCYHRGELYWNNPCSQFLSKGT